MNDLGRYMGARLMTSWTVNLNVYGAEESPDYEYEDSFSGTLVDCLTTLEKFQKVIDDNYIDGYLSIQSDRGNAYYAGDLEHVLEDLLDRGYITKGEMEAHSRYVLG